MFGSFSGFNMNMPVYGGEVQTPALGLDLQCFDSEGKFKKISIKTIFSTEKFCRRESFGYEKE